MGVTNHRNTLRQTLRHQSWPPQSGFTFQPLQKGCVPTSQREREDATQRELPYPVMSETTTSQPACQDRQGDFPQVLQLMQGRGIKAHKKNRQKGRMSSSPRPRHQTQVHPSGTYCIQALSRERGLWWKEVFSGLKCPIISNPYF